MSAIAERCRERLTMSQFLCKDDLYRRMNQDRQDAASEIDRLSDNVEFWKALAERYMPLPTPPRTASDEEGNDG